MENLKTYLAAGFISLISMSGQAQTICDTIVNEKRWLITECFDLRETEKRPSVLNGQNKMIGDEIYLSKIYFNDKLCATRRYRDIFFGNLLIRSYKERYYKNGKKDMSGKYLYFSQWEYDLESKKWKLDSEEGGYLPSFFSALKTFVNTYR